MVVVGLPDEELAERELAALVHRLRQVIEQRRIDSGTDCPDDGR
jgi:hypothetical protein